MIRHNFYYAFVLLLSGCGARLLLDVQGNLELVPIRTGANFTIPSDTLLRDESGVPHNLLEELNTIKQTLNNLQLQLQSLTEYSPACDWEGTRCHCFYKSSPTLDDILILTGSNCTNGQIGAMRILDALVATTIVGCSFFNTTGRCTDVIL